MKQKQTGKDLHQPRLETKLPTTVESAQQRGVVFTSRNAFLVLRSDSESGRAQFYYTSRLSRAPTCLGHEGRSCFIGYLMRSGICRPWVGKQRSINSQAYLQSKSKLKVSSRHKDFLSTFCCFKDWLKDFLSTFCGYIW